MASLTRIRAALGTALATIPGLSVEPDLPAVVNMGEGGAAVVGGATLSDYYSAMGRGLTVWSIELYLLMPSTNYAAATARLDLLVNPVGAESVPNLLWEQGRASAGGLGVLDSNGEVDLDISSAALTGYGVEFVNAGQPHIGAVITLGARTDPREP